MQPYQWMATFTPQREWIERRGILLWLAFFFLELGAGLYFISLLFDSWWGYLMGWLTTLVIGGGFHLLYLGRPLRFWRVAARPQTSWISRGMIFLTLYVVIGVIHLSLSYGAPGGEPVALKILMATVSLLLVVYGAFAMNYLIAIPFWNTPLLPVLYLVSGLWDGAEMALAIALIRGDSALKESVETWIRGLLLSYVVVVAVYLLGIRYTAPAANYSVRELVRGRMGGLFYTGVIAIGVMAPAAVAVYSLMAGVSRVEPAILFAAIACALVGDLSLRYGILRCGFYEPLVPLPLSQKGDTGGFFHGLNTASNPS